MSTAESDLVSASEVGEGIVEGHHVFLLDVLGEGVTHPGRRGMDAPGGNAGGHRGDRGTGKVILERRVSSRVASVSTRPGIT